MEVFWTTQLNRLPTEIWLRVSEELSENSLASLALTTRYFNRILMPKIAGYRSLCLIAHENENSVVDYIKTHHNTDGRVQDKHGATILHHAALRGYRKLLELLISLPQHRRQLDIREFKGKNTPLILAAQWQRHEIIQVLIDAGSDVNAQNANHESALFWAIKRHQPRLVQLILHKGAHLDIRVGYGLTPLIMAIIENRADVVTILLDNGASVTEPDGQGHRPLSWAVDVYSVPIAHILVCYGADPRQPDEDGQTPLHWASKQIDQEMVRFLLRH